jgi:hypothetical protein
LLHKLVSPAIGIVAVWRFQNRSTPFFASSGESVGGFGPRLTL